MTRPRLTTVRAGVSMALVLGAALAGLIGTGLIYTALTDHVWGALIWGLPLALGGLYWCGRALAQGQRSLRQRRISRARGAAGAPLHLTHPRPLCDRVAQPRPQTTIAVTNSHIA